MLNQSFLILVAVLVTVLRIDISFAETHKSSSVTSQLGLQATLSLTLESGNKELFLSGESERSFLFFDVYNIGYYTEHQNELKLNTVEVLYLVYERDLDKEKVYQALRDGVARSLDGAQLNKVSEEFERLLTSINSDVKEGDTLVILKDHTGVLTFFYNNKKMNSISSVLLANALWDIWMGEHSVVNRKSLIRGLQ